MLTALLMVIGFQTPPHALVVFYGSTGVAMNTYHSIWACEKGRDALLEAVAKDNAQRAKKRSGPPREITAYCIPG
ncbi:MAG: hypothetical protein EON59_08675 [Alphaproteobacteria bacterium]|nr:MAG: hypothetical protein EON59_08675 [Alphaproteobacteria bacterium]